MVARMVKKCMSCSIVQQLCWHIRKFMKFKKLCIVFSLCLIGWVSDTSPEKKPLKATIINNPTAESFTVVVKNNDNTKKISQATFTKEATGLGKNCTMILEKKTTAQI